MAKLSSVYVDMGYNFLLTLYACDGSTHSIDDKIENMLLTEEH